MNEPSPSSSSSFSSSSSTQAADFTKDSTTRTTTSTRTNGTLMLIAGEVSGDTHAARLATELQRQQPGLKLFGAGGPRMKEAGVELLLDLTEHAVVGLTDVLANYRKFRRFFWQLVAEAERRRPDAVILTDYPGFNLRFARQMKARSIRVFYYISPQVWAWAPWRVGNIARDVDLMMVIFPFEKEFYARRAPQLPVEFVGHPLVEELGQRLGRLPRETDLVALLPGSRAQEVSRILPAMVGAAELLRGNQPALRFELAAASEKIVSLARGLVGDLPVGIRVGGAHELMQRATAGMVASGTATLESALFGLPHVLVYRVSWPTYILGRALVAVPHLGIVNVMSGREIVPEFIQHHATPDRLAQAVGGMLDNPARREQMQRDLARAVASLEGERAAGRAAAAVLAKLKDARS